MKWIEFVFYFLDRIYRIIRIPFGRSPDENDEENYPKNPVDPV
jgi:hypothetical protein